MLFPKQDLTILNHVCALLSNTFLRRKGLIKMARGRRRSFQEQYLQVPNSTAKAPESKNNVKTISLGALGLIVNICSYSDNWELNKTELYKRFGSHKETAVRTLWKELIEARYIVEYRYRVGRKWEYVYIYDIVPYTPEQIEIILKEATEEFGEIRKLENLDTKGSAEDLNFKTSNCRPQNLGVNKYKGTKNKLTKNKTKDHEEEERARAEENFEINNFAFKEFMKDFNTHMPNYFDNEAYSRIYQEMIKQKVSFITVAEAIEQARKMANRKEIDPPIYNRFNYFVGGIRMNRTSKTNAVAAEKFRKGLAEQKAHDQQEKANDKQEPLPFYNWLDQD